MTLTMGRSNRTQTWGARSAELELEEEQAAAAQAHARLDHNLSLGEVVFDDLLFRKLVQILVRMALPSIVLSRTFGGRSISLGGPEPDPWEFKNRRRVFLIDKSFQGGLSQAEQAELDELQAEHGAYFDAIQPPPFDKLEELEAFARQLKVSHLPPAP
jgi:hypothetical protein